MIFKEQQNHHKFEKNIETSFPKKHPLCCNAVRILVDVHLTNILHNRRLNLKWIVEQDETRIQQVKKEFYIGEEIPFLKPSERERLLRDKT